MKLFALEKDESESINEEDIELRLLQDDKDLGDAIEELNQSKIAIEELNLLTESLLNKQVSLEYAIKQVDHIFSRIGLNSIQSSITLEDINSLPYDIALESILETIKNGLSRIANGFLGIADFVADKLAVGIRNLKAAISGIESSILKAEGMIDSIPEKTDNTFITRSNIAKNLQTRDGKILDFKATEEILLNHLTILENFNKHKEIINNLNKYNLEEYRDLIEKALKNNVSERELNYFTKEQKEQVEELRKIYDVFKNFVGKPLARGKSLYVHFDKTAPNRFIFYKDIFQFNIITLLGMKPPKEAKQLNRKEAQELVKHLRSLKDIYLKTEDFVSNISFIRQNQLKVFSWARLVSAVGAIIPSISIKLLSLIFTIVYDLLFFYFSILIVIRSLGISSSSLCYSAIKGTTRYIQKSARA